MGTYLKWIIIIVILLFFITFGIQNSQSVSLNYYLGLESIDLPLYGLVFISILLGILGGIVIGISDRMTLRRKVRDLAQANRKLQEEIGGMKGREESRFKEGEPPPA